MDHTAEHVKAFCVFAETGFTDNRGKCYTSDDNLMQRDSDSSIPGCCIWSAIQKEVDVDVIAAQPKMTEDWQACKSNSSRVSHCFADETRSSKLLP